MSSDTMRERKHPMSVIEDTRKVAQDFLAPELKGIAARLDALERHLDDLDRRVEKRFDDAAKTAERNQQALLLAIANLSNYYELKTRVDRLESRDATHS